MFTLPASNIQRCHTPRFDPGGKITGINAKNQGLHVQRSFTLSGNGTQRNPTEEKLKGIFSVLPTCEMFASHVMEAGIFPKEVVPKRTQQRTLGFEAHIVVSIIQYHLE